MWESNKLTDTRTPRIGGDHVTLESTGIRAGDFLHFDRWYAACVLGKRDSGLIQPGAPQSTNAGIVHGVSFALLAALPSIAKTSRVRFIQRADMAVATSGLQSHRTRGNNAAWPANPGSPKIVSRVVHGGIPVKSHRACASQAGPPFFMAGTRSRPR